MEIDLQAPAGIDFHILLRSWFVIYTVHPPISCI